MTPRRLQLPLALGLLAIIAACGRESTEPARPTTAPAAGTTVIDPGGRVLPRVFPVVPPAPRPSGALAPDASCVTAECHADYTRASHIHSPVAQQACLACHQPDAGAHTYPLLREGNALCTFCHNVSGTQPVQHQALDSGCLTCHSPHTSSTKYLLNRPSIQATCATCHNTGLRKFAHQPYLQGDCSLCHEPHQSANKTLLRGGSGPEHCYSCHREIKADLAAANVIHKPVGESCASCHQAHTTDYAHQLSTPLADNCLACHEPIKQRQAAAPVKHSAMVQDKSCANCHDPHASVDPKLVRQRMTATCLTCHDRAITAADGRRIAPMKDVLTKSRFLHGPIRDGGCSGCHDPHGGDFAGLLVKAFPASFYTSFDLGKYELCFSCHAADLVTQATTDRLTNFRDGATNLHFLHVNRDVKGRSCKTCHAIHGSDLPNHMATDVPFENSNWSMPIEFEKAPDGGKCTPGCHGPRAYNRGAPTTRPTTMGAP